MKKKKKVYGVFHTTENGANYLVKCLRTREEAIDYTYYNKDNFERELIIKAITF
jgi:hypothetical protein